MKTIYITDLDGTLLHSDSYLSDYAAKTLNTMMENGMDFTLATARSPFSVTKGRLTGLKIRLPALLMNGGLEYDLNRSKVLNMITIDPGDARNILSNARQQGLEPLIYTYDADDRQRVYTASIINPQQRLFIESRQSEGDNRFVIGDDLETVFNQSIFYLTSIGDYAALEPLEAYYKSHGFPCHLYEDVYLHIHLLEVSGKGATKGEAVTRLKKRCGADRLVAFGDNLNDLAMLEAADYAVATANALDEVKAAADEVCPSCDEDGVVQWLIHNTAFFKEH